MLDLPPLMGPGMNHTNKVCRHHVPHYICIIAQIYVFTNKFEVTFLIPVKHRLEETDLLYYSSFYGIIFCKNSCY